jgi:serine-type D-Ala-D-Ala carboxypeptidase/endopeptidase (penicillin-binding protein 4)
MYGVLPLKMRRSTEAARPRIAALLALLTALAAAFATAIAIPAHADERGLSARLGGAMSAAGSWSGAYVFNATSGRPVFAWRHTTPRILASNTKLFTTAAALARFGVEGTLTTEVRGTGSLDARGIYRGDLYLVGGGDPTFGSQSFTARAYGGGATVEALAAQLDRIGIERVAGRVLGDESAFDSLRGGPDSGYGTSIWVGPLSALGYNRGLANENGSSFQASPPAFAAARLADALRRRRIAVTGAPRAGAAPASARILAAVTSPPMERLAALTNKPSDNYFAEMLVKALGMRIATPDRSASDESPSSDSQAERGLVTRAPSTAQTLTQPEPRVIARGTTAGGAKIAARFASRLGGGPTRLADGSGLSRLNRASPYRVVKLLLALRERDEFLAFNRSLSIAGRDGTLGTRMRGGPARGHCRGKTGTLSNVSAVSGYCRARSGDTYVFSILMNGVDPYGARSIQDGMLQSLAGVR